MRRSPPALESRAGREGMAQSKAPTGGGDTEPHLTFPSSCFILLCKSKQGLGASMDGQRETSPLISSRKKGFSF